MRGGVAFLDVIMEEQLQANALGVGTYLMVVYAN